MLTDEMTRLIDRFGDLRVVVVGETMLDSYLEGDARRISREAPVPIVDVARRADAPGGAANTALNLARLGARASLVSVAGEDAEGEAVRTALDAAGVDTDHLIEVAGRRTLAKTRVVAAGQLLVRFDQGTTAAVDADVERVLVDRLWRLYDAADALVVSDYGYGILTPGVVRALAEMQAQHRRTVIVDSRDLPRYRPLRPSAVKPNYDETAALLGLRRADGPDARAQQVAEHAERLLEMTGAHIGAITLDADGALLFERGAPPYRTWARPARNTRAAGAGDTFVSALTAALAAGATPPAAAELASAAAAVVVGKDGTCACSATELRAYLTADDKCVDDRERFLRRIEFHREQGRRVVFTNGCFDILHRGHITYLNRAKALGDILVVGVNSDASVARLKGPSRPINGLEDRVQVLSALSCVDHIVPFDEDTPEALIRAVRPHVYVKGGDYTRGMLPEAPLVEQLGGVVQILPYLEERSTTGVIERIRNAEAGGENGHGRDRRPGRVGRREERPVRPARHDR
ncbi:MAG TPA: D-glycero-beta-D-manno-heptose 1-phosphate adenylyltransferase [Dehalococcoidia bacterium]|nr:D-glycero-beta-D-manno-heptose 1-phosphate adenylyltransferase [Dehalococcoidia bacterium]